MIRMGRGSKEPENEQKPQQQPVQQAVVNNQPPPQNQSYEQQFHYPVNETVPTTTRAFTESESLARSIKEGTMSGFVGAGTSLSGEVSFKAMWRIDGQFSGRITSEDGTLLIGTGGQVDANIEVAVATVTGIVNGDITATQRIELGRTARVKGNIQTPSLIIEQGAIFEGGCRMLQQMAEVEKQQEKVAVPEPPARERIRLERANAANSTIANSPTEKTPESEEVAVKAEAKS